jgi:hypothetical protein
VARVHPDEKYEGSAADLAEDKRMAKKRGMTIDEWEGSAEDQALDEQEAKGTTKNVPEHHFAHGRPRTE